MFRRRPDVPATPIDGVDVILADLDGVVYKGPDAIPYAVDALNAAAASGIRVGYITNNASRSDSIVAKHLADFGLNVTADDVVTSPQAAMSLLRGLVPEGALLLVVGGEGLVTEIERSGFRVTRSAADKPDAVVQGFAPEVGWKDLAEAAFALARDAEGNGIPWVATNTDWTIPVAGGIAPGNGTLVSAVHTAVGILPEVAGKPEKPIFDEAVRRFAATSPLFIGDRLDTDILGAVRAGMPSVHVLTGIDRNKQLLAADAKMRPTFILDDLRQLSEPYPVATTRGDVTTVGSAKVALRGNRVVIDSPGDRPVDLLRAACAVIWNSGTPIYALDVPEELYRPAKTA
ncbi:HAD-IIA family hydrolase [Amnibacterium flavum]|uniref:Haloacid dehalogenase n=1 Tax=Amnibacterium flavum TaxID=2173173 RepID=A0A2V1HUY4_9MICO|nr:HAD-IIA family hydrolase [Amnibacterium flavum]PVZ94829.1 haloacid dehalogenase [Amnibacterium flavum]